ncbi:hypothetical protein M3Y98_00574700 [Aphelenchoides besseyi]|nr:hypothetical protein M3Y98_00574700 [Aphelenchoides besseyi]KAI6193824.1 hypothetical protein M3Y96_01059800 [Aphelenchoides besseyi]
MFNEIQVNRLIELVRANESKLFPSTFNKWNRNQSRQTWTQIACIFNSEFPTEMKTADQIRVKWKNMRQRARETGDTLSINSPNQLQKNTENKERVNEPVAVESTETKSLNASIAQVLGVLGTTIEKREFGAEAESECSIPSCTSDKSGDDQRTLTTDLLSSPFRRFHTPLITPGPPIFPLHSNRHLFFDDNETQNASSPKRSRLVVDENDVLKREILQNELQNSRKLGQVLDEALYLLRQLNKSND